MSLGALHKWIVFVLVILRLVAPQMPMSWPMMYPMPMPLPPPPPPIAMPVLFYISTTTTTTTPAPDNQAFGGGAIAVPMPMAVPLPLQVAVPGYMPPQCNKGNCPPCPPCSCNPCTPAFFSFCSPCHQKCRCRNPKDAPIPLPPIPPVPAPGPAFPMPMPIGAPPAPVVVIPLPPPAPVPAFQNDQRECEDSEDDDSDSDSRPHKRRRKRPYDIYRRFLVEQDSETDNNALVKPVLTYLNKYGDVKIKRRLSNAEADDLIDDANSMQLIGADEQSTLNKTGQRRFYLSSNNGRRLRTKGNKEIVFTPPENRKIKNLKLSFRLEK